MSTYRLLALRFERKTAICGRFTLRARLNDLMAEYDLKRALKYESKEFAPTNPVPIVRMADVREMVNVTWWLIPKWSKTGKPDWKYPTFNARVDTVAEKSTFREPFRKRRCLVLSDGWIEWPRVGGTDTKPIKQKTILHRPDNAPMALAGLWERWEKDEQVVESCTVIVRDPSPDLAKYHDRMPIVLPPRVHETWLDPELQEKEPLLAMLNEFDTDGVVGTAMEAPKEMRATKKKT